MIAAPQEIGGAVVVIDAMAYDDALTALSEAEVAHARALPPLRAHEWAVGRACLRRALAEVMPGSQRYQGDLLVNDRGAPLVDATLRVSLSHKNGVAVAWAQRADALGAASCHLGIDIETLAPPRRPIESRVLVPSEVALLPDEPVARAAMLKTFFAIKEATYKAIHPILRRYVGFAEAEVAVSHQGRCRVAIAGHPDLVVQAAFVPYRDAVVAMAWAQAGAMP